MLAQSVLRLSLHCVPACWYKVTWGSHVTLRILKTSTAAYRAAWKAMKHSLSNKKADNWEIDGFQSRNLQFLSNRGSIKTQLDFKMKALNPELVSCIAKAQDLQSRDLRWIHWPWCQKSSLVVLFSFFCDVRVQGSKCSVAVPQAACRQNQKGERWHFEA